MPPAQRPVIVDVGATFVSGDAPSIFKAVLQDRADGLPGPLLPQIFASYLYFLRHENCAILLQTSTV